MRNLSTSGSGSFLDGAANHKRFFSPEHIKIMNLYFSFLAEAKNASESLLQRSASPALDKTKTRPKARNSNNLLEKYKKTKVKPTKFNKPTTIMSKFLVYESFVFRFVFFFD